MDAYIYASVGRCITGVFSLAMITKQKYSPDGSILMSVLAEAGCDAKQYHSLSCYYATLSTESRITYVRVSSALHIQLYSPIWQ